MSLDGVFFPAPFRLSNRNPGSLPEKEQRAAITNFQVAIFESAKRAGHKLRPSVLSAGTTLFRNVAAEYGKTGDQARTVPPNSSKETNARWSGLIDGTTIGKGALYTSLDTKGLLNEARRYRRETITRSVPWIGSANSEAKYTFFGPTTKDYGRLLVDHVYYSFKLKRAVEIIDISAAAANVFWDAVENDRQYQAAKRDLRVQQELWKIAFDPVDYPGSRPLGLSVLLGSLGEGLQVESAQNEVPEIPGSGTNVVFAGEDGRQLDFIEPVGKLLAGTSEGNPALLEIKLDRGSVDSTIVAPGTVVPIPSDK